MATEYTESIEQLLKEILPQTPGVIRSVAAQEIRDAMREFFEKSYAWIKIVEDVAISTGDTAIQITDSDANTEVIAILDVRHGNDTDGYQRVWSMTGEPNLIEGNNSRPTHWYVTSNPDELKLHPYASEATTDVLRVKVALIPSASVAVNELDLPRQITLKFKEAIKDLTLARLYMHPSKPYSQPVLAQQLRHRGLKAAGYYAAQRKKGFNNTPAWRYPPGWSK
jgi:hypothetical protein